MSSSAQEQEVWLPAEAPELARARALVDDAAAAAGFDDGCRFEITMAINEALTNAMEHGEPCRGGTVLLRVIPQTSALTVCVCDCGSFDPEAETSDPLAERGRGLDFMRMFMDEVEVMPDAHGTLIRLVKRAVL